MNSKDKKNEYVKILSLAFIFKFKKIIDPLRISYISFLCDLDGKDTLNVPYMKFSCVVDIWKRGGNNNSNDNGLNRFHYAPLMS